MNAPATLCTCGHRVIDGRPLPKGNLGKPLKDAICAPCYEHALNAVKKQLLDDADAGNPRGAKEPA